MPNDSLDMFHYISNENPITTITSHRVKPHLKQSILLISVLD
jgi:hypothetical protein